MLEHGGKLRIAAQRYGIALADWVDLSTGINPDCYPIPPIDPLCWQRLPEDNDGLEQAAAEYYGNDSLLVLPGSQAAIQSLPFLFKRISIACLTPLYEEHPQAWERTGHKLRHLPTLQRVLAAATPNVLLCNPNNPTAITLPRSALIDAAEQLRKRGGWLIVDEAFADAEPEHSIVELAGSKDAPNLIVLRSLGKFFGLAGARVGFLFATRDKLDPLREMLGPWPVANPSRAVACHALKNRAWQAQARDQLVAASQRLASLLTPLGEVSRTALFCTVKTPNVALIHEHFARHGLLTRRFDQHSLLRFGLPGPEAQWQRLGSALAAWKEVASGMA